MAAYNAANYKVAIPLLQAAVAKTPKDPNLCAALLSALLYEGRADEAADAAEADASEFPNSPEVITARGEFAFYMSDMAEAERLFKSALKLKETPRALDGLSRLFYMASMYRTARLLCLRAHELDPDDAQITMHWLQYVVPEKRRELIGPFLVAHPWLYKNFERNQENASEIRRELNGKKIFEPVDERKETMLHFFYIRDSSQRHVAGVGLELAVQGGKPLRMLFDSGASGILIRQAAIDKAGLSHLGSSEARGIGDKGARDSFFAIADECSVGQLKFKNCVLEATEGKARVSDDESDGLLGADFFADYIMQIDFQKATLHLTPQSERPPNPQGYDRTIPPEEVGFTPVFRRGGHLFVPTTVNRKSSGLFLLDTGSQMSMMDASFARLSTKVHGDSWMSVRGVSGEVKNVFEADKAELQFARFRQANLGLISIDLNNVPDPQPFRMGGILGAPILSMFRLTLDYRNGLVNFDYVFDRHK